MNHRTFAQQIQSSRRSWKYLKVVSESLICSTNLSDMAMVLNFEVMLEQTLNQSVKNPVLLCNVTSLKLFTCSNYRGISLLCTTYKMFSNILFKRLAPYVEDVISDYQYGFCQGRSTSNQIFNLRQVLEKCNKFGTETYHLFMHFRAA
jgi:hypothetical protein